jgi:hypothetical protein
MAITHIYSLDCPITGDVKYIGKSDCPDYRYRKHLEGAIRNKKPTKKNNWIISLNNQGLKPILTIIDSIDNSEWRFWEMHYISLYKSFGFDLKNMTFGGDGGKMSKESIDKIIEANRKRRHTEEHKKMISKIMLGNKYAAGNKIRRKETICFDTITGKITYYDSSHHAALELSVSRQSIANNICGLSKLVKKKYIFFN